ncbi:uncharacterized protein TrAtP1_002219 [Trichoderma atroviride]|uniref:uncharacterized protein n=1 Tax=Hypocrea atroviridis TaxID=63577 RepID=UPI00331FF308|nr:hypothetical protein TrAtP1_002219 [Trichoderma atroviride]
MYRGYSSAPSPAVAPKWAAQSSRPPLSDHAEAACIDSASATLILPYSPHTSTKCPSPSTYFDTGASMRGSCSELLPLPLTPTTHSHAIAYKNKLNAREDITRQTIYKQGEDEKQ